VHRSQSATENISTSMDGWRETFEGMPNWATNLFDVAFVVVGLVLVLQLGTAGTLVGAVVILLGAVGIADAIYQRVRPWLRRWR